jgi:hypothetical protein
MATHSYLGQVLVGATSTTSYTSLTSVGQVISISGPNISVSVVKTTHLASSNAADEFIPGFADGGTINTRMNFVKADTNTLYGYYRTMKGIMVMFNDGANSSVGSRWTFDGFISEFGNEVPENDRITADITIKVTGKPAFTTAS